jgi:hypothetical protein
MSRLRLFSPAHGPERGRDPGGDGAFGASRCSRLHAGRDYLANPKANISAPCDGRVARIGQCYPDDPTYKLVEIAHEIALVRVLYIEPCVKQGDVVQVGQTIGYAQDVAARYGGGMQNHVHLDVRMMDGVLCGRGETPDDVIWIDPALFMG